MNNLNESDIIQQQQPQPPPPSLSGSITNLLLAATTISTTQDSHCLSLYGTTPTINVVCPIGEETFMETDEMQLSVTEEEDEDDIDDADDDARTPTNATNELHQLDVNTYDDKNIPQEELSPTTEEYQECCPPDDYQYDISTEGEILVPGCVAPAPTPAPSIAPLAEVEIDPTDDDPDTEEAAIEICCDIAIDDTAATVADALPTTSEVKKRRKKRNSETKVDKADTEASQESLVTPQADDGQHGRNAVCPWEDE